jgi:3-(3-hydroxy-phenyl)propionate hydroxylase
VERIGIDHETDQYPCFKSEGPVLGQRYGKDTVYLVRPDGHVAASFAEVDTELLRSAYGKAMGYSHAGERSYA